MMDPAPLLPPEFADLERFVAYWDTPTSEERIGRRTNASMAVINDFYTTVQPRASEVLAYLDRYTLDTLPDDAARLFRLLLALTHASIAVEMHGQPRVPFSTHPTAIRLLRGAPPYG